MFHDLSAQSYRLAVHTSACAPLRMFTSPERGAVAAERSGFQTGSGQTCVLQKGHKSPKCCHVLS